MIKFIKKNFKYILIGLLALFFYSAFGKYMDQKAENRRLHQDLIGKTEKYQQLNEHVANLERKYVEQSELRRKVGETFGRERYSLKGLIKILSNAAVVEEGYNAEKVWV